MASTADPREFWRHRESRRESIRALRAAAMVAIVATVALFGLDQLFAIPLWVFILVLGCLGLALLGDAINFVYQSLVIRRLRSKLERSQAS